MHLSLHGRTIESIFELLGSKENSITYSVGWALANAPNLRNEVLQRIGLAGQEINDIKLQEHGDDGGFTDIEMLGPSAHAIIEAKRGWWLPGDLQWRRYAPRFKTEKRNERRFVAMSDCSSQYAALHLDSHIADVGLSYIAWRDLAQIAETLRGSHAEKRLGGQLATYLRTVATMQNKHSNWVYVVSLGSGIPNDAQISWIDIVAERSMYFHKIGHRWPKEPPNYIAFRYWGRLQSIHHVEDYVVSTNLHEQIPEMPDRPCELPHFVYHLGPPIHPPHEVKNGPRVNRSARIWTMLDLLLTSQTISEAMDKSDARWHSVPGSLWPPS
ncbi:MAG: hypothetical protein DCC46_11020 [Armatimonadetes bacterium]|nr:MAG: hypothetical protein DCC46_11020 [Armatimonadota bacterium]